MHVPVGCTSFMCQVWDWIWSFICWPLIHVSPTCEELFPQKDNVILFISWMFKVWLYLDPPNFKTKSYSTFYLALIILLPHIRWDPTMKDWWHFVVTQAKRNRRTVHWNSSLQQSGSRKVIHSLLYQHLHSQVLNFTLPKGVPSLIKRF